MIPTNDYCPYNLLIIKQKSILTSAHYSSVCVGSAQHVAELGNEYELVIDNVSCVHTH